MSWLGEKKTKLRKPCPPERVASARKQKAVAAVTHRYRRIHDREDRNVCLNSLAVIFFSPAEIFQNVRTDQQERHQARKPTC